MKEFNSIEDILNFAIAAEQEAVEFYTQLALMARNEQIKRVFEEFAREEIGHKARLTEIRTSGINVLGNTNVPDLKIAELMESIEVKPDMTYPEALIVAMKREKAAFRMYTKLAERAPSPEYKELFQTLALEESRHKLRFEVEYDDFVMKEN